MLAIVDGFVAITAVGGGIALMTGLENNRFPTEMLGSTPFPSFVVPGLILAIVVGGSATTATFELLSRRKGGALASALAGAILIGWIVGEVLFLPASAWSWLEALYFTLGLAMAITGLSIERDEVRKPISG
jgi:hypothetical protein